MRIAAFNVENLFDRAKALNEGDAEATAVIKAVAELSALFEKPVYSDADRARMLALMQELGILRQDEGPFVWLRRIRGKLVHRPRGGRPVTIEAAGRADWVGWVEHKTVHLNEIAVMNTGRVIRDVNADILAVVEAENRVALTNFTRYVLGKVEAEVPAPPLPYEQVMLIDGNDMRGIDVGIMTKNGFGIGLMRSHVSELMPNGKPLFSRDCPEYAVTTPGGATVWVLPNHFKSKFGGDGQAVRDQRAAQARRVRAIYDRLLVDGHENVVVLGDLNDTPDSVPLAPLIGNGGPQDVGQHPSFDPGEHSGIGTFGNGSARNKIDYLMLSPALFARVRACGLFRKGAWPGKQNPKWTVYPELQKEIHVASDHHVIWADLDLA